MPCAGNVPVIVASGSINQPSGGDISTTTLFTPAADGVFRVSLYFDGVVAWAGNATSVIFSWTDDSGAQHITMPMSNLPYGFSNSPHSAAIAIPIHAAAAVITIATSGNTDTNNYTLYYIVEQLA
jgi:hypothetical protein